MEERDDNLYTWLQEKYDGLSARVQQQHYEISMLRSNAVLLDNMLIHYTGIFPNNINHVY